VKRTLYQLSDLSRPPSVNLPFPRPRPNRNGAMRMLPSGFVPISEQLDASVFVPALIPHNPSTHPAGGSTGPIFTAVRTSARAPRSCRVPRIKPSSPGRLSHRLDLRLKRCARDRRAACVGKLCRSRLASGSSLARYRRAQESATRAATLRTIFRRGCATQKAFSIGSGCGARSGGLRGTLR
jgi:hypothetical protein